MKNFNEIIQWIGACFIIMGHVLNAIGTSMYPYNIMAFTLGTLCFMTWTIRVKNRPQLTVQIVAIAVCVIGLVKAYYQ